MCCLFSVICREFSGGGGGFFFWNESINCSITIRSSLNATFRPLEFETNVSAPVLHTAENNSDETETKHKSTKSYQF